MIHNYSILDDRFCRKIQDISFIEKSMPLFTQLKEVWFEEDEFIIEYDDEHKLHVLIHKSTKFNEEIPLCYFDVNKFRTKEFHAFVIEWFIDRYAEYLI